MLKIFRIGKDARRIVRKLFQDTCIFRGRFQNITADKTKPARQDQWQKMVAVQGKFQEITSRKTVRRLNVQMQFQLPFTLLVHIAFHFFGMYPYERAEQQKRDEIEYEHEKRYDSLSDRATPVALFDQRCQQELIDDVELLSAGREMDMQAVRDGQLSPVFFGSALTNFGIEPFLEAFLKLTPPPLARTADCGVIDPFSPDFSAFVFKIQANMNKAHRDRVAFLRICSGQFERGREYWHVQADRPVKLSQPQQMMAQEREIVDTAYAGDIIGVFDPGIFSIGDTVCEKGEKLRYAGIPTFAPEHFAMVEQIDSMKRKQFAKGVTEIAQEGAIQIFFEPGTGMERVVVGVVGVLQFDVLQFRMESEYGVRYNKRDLPHQLIRYIDNADLNPAELKLMQTTRWVQDVRGRNLLIFVGQYEIDWALDKNPGLMLSEFNQNTDAV